MNDNYLSKLRQDMLLKNFAANTYDDYYRFVKRFLDFTDKDAMSVTYADIRKFIFHMKDVEHTSFQNIIPCPDLFMPTKILLHKANAWGHEREWRLTCSCNSAEFNQQEFSCTRKKPTALYLGRKISQIHEKILQHIAVEINIPVYKMQIREDESAYKLYPQVCS